MSGYKNYEGYNDPTARCAFYADERRRKARFIIRIILFIAWEAGFRVVSRIEIEDRRTGKIY